MPGWSRKLLDFTGERVIPGLVDPDLLNEHLARYRFAATFTDGATVLDAGCGSGYGAAEFVTAASVVGVDISAEAVSHARGNYSRDGVHFIQASCDALPFADGSFDVLVAFEVIEHLESWQEMLREARRVLRATGMLLVSTPNKAYYAEARGAAGPNPFHVREFEYDEFEAALLAVFPYVSLWSQNHSESIAFLPSMRSPGDFDAPGDATPERAHFFLAACSQSPLPGTRAFAWSAESGNVLRERERHIALLEGEVAQKDDWLTGMKADRARLQAELDQRNEWAKRLDAELKEAGETIARVQAELDAAHAGYQMRARQLELELAGTHSGYRDRIQLLEEELAAAHAGYQEQVRELELESAARLDWGRELENELVDRTRWAQSLDVKWARAETQLHLAAGSRWVRLGRLLHLGPEITGGDGQPE
jgi:ubiquinone/menaquinone biosynthesis C-methylase UbiE